MNCRRVNSLLSAFIDSELTGEEMLAVRDHVEHCAECAAEHDALLQTKRLLSSLAFRTPRADMEELLRSAIEHEERRPFRRWIENPLWQPLRSAWEAVAYTEIPARPGTLLATMALSVAGLWFASGVMDRMEGSRHYHPTGELVLLSRVPLAAHPVLVNAGPTSSASSYAPVGFGSGGTVTSAAYMPEEMPMDPPLVATDRYAAPASAPTHVQAGFSADLGFTLSIGGAPNRASSRPRSLDTALLLR